MCTTSLMCQPLPSALRLLRNSSNAEGGGWPARLTYDLGGMLHTIIQVWMVAGLKGQVRGQGSGAPSLGARGQPARVSLVNMDTSRVSMPRGVGGSGIGWLWRREHYCTGDIAEQAGDKRTEKQDIIRNPKIWIMYKIPLHNVYIRTYKQFICTVIFQDT